jgi:hypothetical protein
MGSDVVEFDPLRDGAVRDGADALVVGGGFPELYAAELAANSALRAHVASRAASGIVCCCRVRRPALARRTLDVHEECAVLPAGGGDVAQADPRVPGVHNTADFVILGMFIVTWVTICIWHFGRIEEKRSAKLQTAPPNTAS